MSLNYQPLSVLYEDNHIIAINKAAGTLSDADKTGNKTLADEVKAYIKEKYNKPGDVFLGTIHRLDRPTSGAILFARTSKALERLNEQLKNREVQKTYWALTIKRPPEIEGTLRNLLYRDLENNTTRISTRQTKDAKEAVLKYSLQLSRGQYHLIEIDLVTGRHHQIRAQLAHVGCPIVGDVKYGFATPNADKSICLHARRLSFMHPTKKEMITIEAPLPKLTEWRAFEKW